MISHVYRRSKRDEPAKTIIAAGGGGTWQKADIILADGTKVYINSDSRIVYDNTYNKKTLLKLFRMMLLKS